MLSATPRSKSFITSDHDRDEQWPQTTSRPVNLSGGWGYSSYGVTSIGRGVDDPHSNALEDEDPGTMHGSFFDRSPKLESKSFIDDTTTTTPPAGNTRPLTTSLIIPHQPQPRSFAQKPTRYVPEPSALSQSPSISRPSSPGTKSRPGSSGSPRPPLGRSTTTPRPRRRSSQQRVSLVAGRVLIAPLEPSSPVIPSLIRHASTASYLSVASSTAPPSPDSPEHAFCPSGRDISAFNIEKEIGRGAYGLVKRATEKSDGGKPGVLPFQPPSVLSMLTVPPPTRLLWS